MAKQMERIIATYKHVSQNSSPISGRILNSFGSNVNISSIWSQRNIERKTVVHSEMIQTLNLGTKEVHSLTSTDISSEILTSYSPSCAYRGVFREIPASGKSPKKQHLEVWQRNKRLKLYDLASIDVHGDVYTDIEFGSFQWSPCETKILYVAEKKQPKSEPFLPRKTDKPDDDAKKGCEYELIEDWGEQLVGKASPVWCVCDLGTNLVSAAGLPHDVSVGQVVWAPDGGIVGLGRTTTPRKLGLIYCSNRDSFVFHLSPDSAFRKLSTEGVAVRSPSFSPDGSKLIWIERPVGGPHDACHRLVLYEWATGQASVVIDIVRDEIQTANGQPFYGLYNLDLGRCWLSNSKITFSTSQRASAQTFIVDLESKEIHSLFDNNDNLSLSVLDVKNDLILCTKSSLMSSPTLLLCRISGVSSPEWIVLLEQEPLISNVDVGILHLEARTQPSPVSKFTALYMVPKDISNAPFIVWSHGGPHSLFRNSTNIMAAFFASLGFGMVMVNYRGSIGSGQASVDFLLGRVGETDVADCQQAAEEVLRIFPEQLSPEKCVLFGGSHGGFLSLHLSAQFPSFYRAVCVRNPVLDMPSVFSVSDIPDWALSVCGFEYTDKQQMTVDMFEKMKSLSPLTRISNVTTPTLLLLGKKDLRVPMSQGMSYYYQLKAKGIKTKVLMYADNHSLSQLPHEIDFAINTAKWYMECLNYSVD